MPDLGGIHKHTALTDSGPLSSILVRIDACYCFGFSPKSNSLEVGESFHRPKSCPFSNRICRNNSLRSSTAAGHIFHFCTYGSIPSKLVGSTARPYSHQQCLPQRSTASGFPYVFPAPSQMQHVSPPGACAIALYSPNCSLHLFHRNRSQELNLPFTTHLRQPSS